MGQRKNSENLPSLPYSIYKHYGIDIASPSSMQDACHMNLAAEACGLVVQHRNAESEGLRFDSSWGIRIFSLSHARDKTKNIFLCIFTELKTYYLSSLFTNSDLLEENEQQ